MTNAARIVDEVLAAYGTTSRCALGVFRIVFVLVLIYDLCHHARALTLLYTNEGLLSNHYVLFRPFAPGLISFLTPFSTRAEVTVAFVLLGVAYALYTLGLFTRVVQWVVPVGTISLVTRNLFTEDGGCVTLIILGFWTLMLPVGDRLSIDALIARAKGRRRLEDEVRSIAVAGLLMQAVIIYYFNFAHKTGQTWQTGEAVHNVLWQNRMSTWFAVWLRTHEPAFLSPVLTRATLLIELAIPVLLLLPWRQTLARSVAFVLSVALHLGIASVMSLGPFSYAMIALMLANVPARVVERAIDIAQQKTQGLRRPLARLSRIVRALVPRELEPKPPVRSTWLGEVWAGAFFAYSVINALHANPAVKRPFRIERLPDWVQQIVHTTRITQSWSMFAPDTPRDDGILIVDAELSSGEHIDPFTGAPPDPLLNQKGPFPHDILTSDMLFKLGTGWHDYRQELARYIMAWKKSPDSHDRVVSFRAYLLTNDVPARENPVVGHVRQRLVLKRP